MEFVIKEEFTVSEFAIVRFYYLLCWIWRCMCEKGRKMCKHLASVGREQGDNMVD